MSSSHKPSSRSISGEIQNIFLQDPPPNPGSPSVHFVYYLPKTINPSPNQSKPKSFGNIQSMAPSGGNTNHIHITNSESPNPNPTPPLRSDNPLTEDPHFGQYLVSNDHLSRTISPHAYHSDENHSVSLQSSPVLLYKSYKPTSPLSEISSIFTNNGGSPVNSDLNNSFDDDKDDFKPKSSIPRVSSHPVLSLAHKDFENLQEYSQTNSNNQPIQVFINNDGITSAFYSVDCPLKSFPSPRDMPSFQPPQSPIQRPRQPLAGDNVSTTPINLAYLELQANSGMKKPQSHILVSSPHPTTWSQPVPIHLINAEELSSACHYPTAQSQDQDNYFEEIDYGTSIFAGPSTSLGPINSASRNTPPRRKSPGSPLSSIGNLSSNSGIGQSPSPDFNKWSPKYKAKTISFRRRSTSFRASNARNHTNTLHPVKKSQKSIHNKTPQLTLASGSQPSFHSIQSLNSRASPVPGHNTNTTHSTGNQPNLTSSLPNIPSSNPSLPTNSNFHTSPVIIFQQSLQMEPDSSPPTLSSYGDWNLMSVSPPPEDDF